MKRCFTNTFHLLKYLLGIIDACRLQYSVVIGNTNSLNFQYLSKGLMWFVNVCVR